MGEISGLTYVLVFVLIGMSAYFSASETAFATVNKVRLKNLMAEGNKKAERVYEIAQDYDRTLSAILIGNNVVNIASASLGTLIFTYWFGDMGVGLSTLVMTIFVLIFGEILPKTFAKENAEAFTMATASILFVLIKVLSPLIWIFVKMKNAVANMGKSNSEKKPTVTEQELKYIIEESQSEGVLEEQESLLVQSALDFDETTLEQVLTPRVDVVAISIDEKIENIKALFFYEGYSRIPVYANSVDSIIGVVHNKDFLKAYIEHKDFDLKSIVQEVVYVPPKKRISELLKDLQKLKSHMAIVVDEYGGTIGIITLEDIIEELVGDIWDESDEEEIDLLKVDENIYHVSGDLNPVDFFERVNYSYNDRDIVDVSNSFAGWILETLEKIPDVGEYFEWQTLNIEVLEVLENRILKVKITINEDVEKDND